MPNYSAINISQRILDPEDRKYPLKESSTINWTREELGEYFEGIKRKRCEDGVNPILPSSPDTFTLD